MKLLKRRLLSLTLAAVMVLLSCPITTAAAQTIDALEVWYKFDEKEGSVAKDFSGNGRDGKIFGDAQWVTTEGGKGVALRLDNTSSSGKYVDVPTTVMENVTGDFTLSTWVKVTDCPTWARIADYGTSTSDVFMWTANNYAFKMDNNSAKVVVPPANGTLSQFRKGCPLSFLWPEGYYTPRWQHVTVTRKGKTTTLWVNAIKWASSTYDSVNPRTGADYKFYLGRSVWAQDPYASMDIRDFRVYSRALSVKEITGVMENGEWSDEVRVNYAIDSVDLGDSGAVRENLYLPTIVNDSVAVSWSSDSAALFVDEYVGAIIRPEAGAGAASAILTGVFSYGDYQKSVDYPVTILPKEADDVAYTMNVDTQNPLHAMSDTMYGLFFEDLSMAGDGGLYGELLRNTCFHDAAASIPFWQLETAGGAVGGMSLDKTNNLNSVQFQHLKLNITSMPSGGSVGIRNEGYNGMEFEVGKKYTLTFFARTDNFAGSVSAQLKSATGEVISAPVAVGGLTSDWRQYSAILTPDEYAAQGEMVLYCEGGVGSVHFDVVSLFPETYKNHGLRKDLVKYMEDLKPDFLRFPGGCYVEGKTMDDAFRWKNTLYGKEMRGGHNSLWNYRVTDGLGYYEFLTLCEDMGIEPMYVCGVGIAHEDSEDWQYWIQDVLDAIEFANGDSSTTWGSVRAAMGHSEPFNMKYVEIGNEAFYQMKLYEPRYQDFYDAIKAKYPSMNLIADCNIEGRSIDMVDEHYYNKPQFFMDNAYKYDNYDRNGYKVYAGEYAVHSYHGLQNLHAALGEAAFMTGMERNCDIVTMSSYSELFVNLNHQNWNATAAFFDSSRSYASPSYYAQKMFGEKLGNSVLPTAFSSSDGTFDSAIRGGVGLGTWNTNATFRDIKVTSNVDGSTLFDSATEGIEAWTSGSGSWSCEGGEVQQTAIASDCRLWLDNKDWTDYTYEVTARKISGNEGFLLILGEKDTNNFYYVNFGGWVNTKSAIEKTVLGSKSTVSASVAGAIEANRDYKLKAVVSGNNIKIYVDGALMFDYTDSGAANCPLYYVAQKDNTSGEIILKVVNTADNDYNVDINLYGAKNVAAEGKATIMTAQSKYEENSFDNPTNVAPVEVTVKNVSESFNYTFMKNSITILSVTADADGVDKSVLKEAFDAEKAAPLAAADYTLISWRDYENALTAADAALSRDASQSEINAALKALLGAKALLVKAPRGQENYELNIDAATLGAPLSPDMYGISFNRDTSLCGEVVKNFGFNALPDTWQIEGGEYLSEDNRSFLHFAQGGSALQCDTFSAEGGEGFDVRLYARGAGAVKVLIVDGERVLGSTVFSDLSDDFKIHSGAVRVNAQTKNATIRIEAQGEAELDALSVTTQNTFCGRGGALRRNAAEKLAADSCGFLRFDAGDWQNAVGPFWERGDALGIYEYLLFCVDANVKAMPVATITDALDLIDFANGDNTPMAAKRAAMGHSAPFNIEYIAVKYADGFDAFEEKLHRLYPSVKLIAAVEGGDASFAFASEEETPSGAWLLANTHRYDTHQRSALPVFVKHTPDDSFYGALCRAAYLTGAERNGDVVKMALFESGAEAALFMSSMGSHSVNATLSSLGQRWGVGVGCTEGAAEFKDITLNGEALNLPFGKQSITASYTPESANGAANLLDGNIATRWASDKIGSYATLDLGSQRFVSKIGVNFMAVSGRKYLYTLSVSSDNVNYRTVFDGESLANTAQEHSSAVGENIRYIRLTSGGNSASGNNWFSPTELCAYDEEGVKLTSLRGTWQSADGVLSQQNASLKNVFSTINAEGDYTLEFKAKKASGALSIPLRYEDDDNYTTWQIGSESGVYSRINGSETLIAAADDSLENGEWYSAAVVTEGDAAKIYLNGALIHSVFIPASLNVSTALDAESGDVILKIVNTASSPKRLNITLDGTDAVAPCASEVVLTADGIKRTEFTGAAQSFCYETEGSAFAVLRLHTKSDYVAAIDEITADLSSLPEQIAVTLHGGSTAMRPVTWRRAEGAFENAGSYKIVGDVSGTSLKAYANVFVGGAYSAAFGDNGAALFTAFTPATAIIAVYSANGVMLDVKTAPVIGDAQIEFVQPENTTVKLMLLDELLTPLCGAQSK